MDDSVLQSTTEHCLMGIKGTVVRSTDGHFIHANGESGLLPSRPLLCYFTVCRYLLAVVC